MESLVQLLTDWGYIGLFLSALLAGSVLPFSSEVVLAALILLGLDPLVCLLTATAGNTLGGLTCYGIGRMGRMEWIEHYLHVRREKVERMRLFLQGKGALMAFFAFLPIAGSVLVIALGFMRSNVVLVTLSMMTGKALRYWVVIYLMM